MLGAQPYALLVTESGGPVPDVGPYSLAFGLTTTAGVVAGIGYAAALALLASRVPSRLARPLTAAGQRSLTCYLAQSVVWTVVFTPFLLGLADDLSIAAIALLAVVTWLTTVVFASRMRGRGPFETLLRRATYGPRSCA